jgi:ATPase subunit of ABC transporter with duplicated ATPase domains
MHWFIVPHFLLLQTVTTMIVSHDAVFLDNVISGVIAYEGFKLRRYKGNLTDFVKVCVCACMCRFVRSSR